MKYYNIGDFVHTIGSTAASYTKYGNTFLLCDGSPYNTTTYAGLYALLGSANLPNLK